MKVYIIFLITLFYSVYADVILFNYGQLKSEDKDWKKNISELFVLPSFYELIEMMTLGFIVSFLSSLTVNIIVNFL
jgi:hypothetical protein